MSPTPTMSAAVLESHGAPFGYTTVARPVAAPGQLLVRIKASAVNPLDLKIRAGQASHARHPLPAILGLDLAGVVEEVGPGVTGFDVGDEVFGMTGGVGGVQGSLAEYAAVDASLVARKPSHFSMREAASLPLAFITAWEGLVDRAGVRAGDTVLVQGGAGGVGQAAIQLARAFGARVFATSSAGKAADIAGLGATPIDYQAIAVEDYVAAHTDGRGFDIVYDTAGGASLDASFKAVKRFGHVVSALGWGTHALAPLSFRAASYSGVFTLLPLLTGEGKAHHREILRKVAALAESGQITPNIDARRFDLTTVGEAHAWLEHRQAQGKVVIDVGGEPPAPDSAP
ncbi:zinc-dependent alcohol dehydrogenase family protein [Dyella soli]|uniref:Quinone oxidoreductase n=1 Tax=Dyella soli TaxID=522319 RepID=A0A4R0YT30_9GAMM|nr:zinc-dependent alcohol dehydrogenase family protein [Dyella soli]TCI11225.1 quinone oxidoreductase [Dyella soli]